jgi:hypothetical protein
MSCHAPGHGHAVPAVVYTADRVRLLRRIADHMKGIQPDFIVMTEGLHDSVLDSVALFHGCVSGVFSPTPAEIHAMQTRSATFSLLPDLFRVTFPEVLTTIRNPRPMEDRLAANFACLFGFRHEIETRYAQDKAYLLDGVIPARNAYDNIAGSRPNVDVMQATPPAEATRYLRTMIDFQRAHADLLWSGRFVGDAGFSLVGPTTLMAKGFVAGERLGVVVWNTAQAPAAITLTAPGYRFAAAWEPEKGSVKPEADLAPGCIRLIVGVRRDAAPQ